MDLNYILVPKDTILSGDLIFSKAPVLELYGKRRLILAIPLILQMMINSFSPPIMEGMHIIQW
jgi:hypothetical protein